MLIVLLCCFCDCVGSVMDNLSLSILSVTTKIKYYYYRPMSSLTSMRYSDESFPGQDTVYFFLNLD